MKRLEILQRAAQLHRDGLLAEAEAAYRSVLANDPADADASQLLGVLALQTGRDDEALSLLRRALAVRPDFPEALNNLGVALEAGGDLAGAEAPLRQAVALRPNYVDAFNNLGNVLRKLGRLDDAATAYGEARRLQPTHPVAYSGLGTVALEQGDLDSALKHFWRYASLQSNNPVAHSDLLFWLLHHPRYSPQQLFEAHRTWAIRHADPLGRDVPPHENAPTTDRPLRVGYVSPDFRDHTVARFVQPLLARHDPCRVVSVCYSDAARPDHITRNLKGLAAEWRDTAGVSDERMAAMIRADRIDILVDLAGHMGGNRLTLFALRPAPVQITYLYPHSTGLEAMDYFLTDAIANPPGPSESFYTEELVRLPGCAWCYWPTDVPVVDVMPADSAGHVTFGAMNRMAKVTPMVAALWARVMAAVPTSHLLLLAPGGEENGAVRRMMESAGVPGDRLRLVACGPRSEYLRRCSEADVPLDPFPYNGMTTTCDLMWLGVPVVTLAGASHAARVGASMLGAVGLADLVAQTPDDYVRIAAALALDKPRLRELRGTLRGRMERSPLRDAAGFTRRVESAFLEMWARWLHSRIAQPSRPTHTNSRTLL